MCSSRRQGERHSDTHQLSERQYPIYMQMRDRGIIGFLDVEFTHQQDGSLSTFTYRKQMHTNQYLHFLSHHPRAYKSSVASTLLRRAFTHCSMEEERKGELARVRDALKKNGYTRQFVTSRLPESTQLSVKEKRKNKSRDNDPRQFACIPYMHKGFRSHCKGDGRR